MPRLVLEQPVVRGLLHGGIARQDVRDSVSRLSGGEICASRLKYAAVVSFNRISGRHSPIRATAPARRTIGFVLSGTDPWPAIPLATSSMRRGIFSSVCTVANVDAARLARDAAALGEAVLGIHSAKWSRDDEVDADAGAALLAGLREKDDVAIERHVLPLQQQHRHQRRRQIVLVVHGASAVDVAAVACRAERRERPLRRDRP